MEPRAEQTAVAAYDRLDPAKVTQTLRDLHGRITHTFPTRHLPDVALVVAAVVAQVERQASLTAPAHRIVRWASRAAIALLVALIAVAIGSAVRTGRAQVGDVKAFEWLTVVEAGVNDVVFAGLAISSSSRCPRASSGGECSRRSTACGRWPTSSTCTR